VSSATLAIDCRSLEKDQAFAESITVKCAYCDPDNPRCVPQESCRACGGSGRRPSSVASIIKDLRRARLALLKNVEEDEVED